MRRKHTIGRKRHSNENHREYALGTVATALPLGLGGCAGMSAQDKSTAVGAGVGAVGEAVLIGGSAIGTVGGIIGHEVGDWRQSGHTEINPIGYFASRVAN